METHSLTLFFIINHKKEKPKNDKAIDQPEIEEIENYTTPGAE